MTDIREIFAKKSTQQRERTQPQLNSYPLQNNTYSYKQPEKKSLFNEHQYSQRSTMPRYQANPLLEIRKNLVDDSKRIIGRQFMKDELQKFGQKMLKQIIWKMLIVLAFLCGFAFGGLFSRKILVEAAIFSLAFLVNISTLAEQNVTIKKWIQIVQYLLFAAIFYDILIQNGYSHPYNHHISIDVPLFILTSIATLNFFVLQKYCFLFQSKVCIPVNIIQKSTNFIRGFFIKIYSIYKIRRILIMINLSFALVFILYCIYNQSDRIFQQTAQISLLIFSSVLFFTLQLFITFLSQLSKINRLSLDIQVHKVSLYISLLRLIPTKQNRLIQQICLKQLASKIQKDMNILETSVKINLVYNNYNDIFQQYQNAVLASQIRQTTQTIFKIQRNSRLVSQNKSLKKDLFIWGRKAIAMMENQYYSLSLLQSINDVVLLFFIISKVEACSNSIKQSTVDNLEQIRGLYHRLSKEKIVSELLRSKFQEWSSQLQHLVLMINSGSKSNQIPRKQNEDGWITCSARKGQTRWL